MSVAWNPLDAELADTLEHALMIRTRYLTALEEAPVPGLAPEALPAGAPSSACAEPCVDEAGVVPAAGLTDKSLSGASVSALSSSRLRTLVAAARQNHGPHHVRWSVRERACWRELVVVRGESV